MNKAILDFLQYLFSITLLLYVDPEKNMVQYVMENETLKITKSTKLINTIDHTKYE